MFRVYAVFCFLVLVVSRVKSIAWKDLFPKRPVMCQVGVEHKTLLTHSFRICAIILTGKVGQIVLVFGVQLGSISRCVRARLQVSVCSGYNLCHRG